MQWWRNLGGNLLQPTGPAARVGRRQIRSSKVGQTRELWVKRAMPEILRRRKSARHRRRYFLDATCIDISVILSVTLTYSSLPN